MFVSRYIFGVVCIGLLGCSKYEQVAPTHLQTVEVSPNVPAQFQNAVLHLSIYDLSPHENERFGERSLKSPGHGDSEIDWGTNSYVTEDRLIAINTNGFVMFFSKSMNGDKQTNSVLFPYGRFTLTNIIEERIIGKFE